jgi:MYND finger
MATAAASTGTCSSGSSTDSGHICAICSKSAGARCGGCRAVWYCSKEHQKAHWPSHKGCCAAAGAGTASADGGASTAGIPAISCAGVGGKAKKFFLPAYHAALEPGARNVYSPPVLQMCGFPLRMYVATKSTPNNRVGTYMMIDPRSGLAPPQFQDNIGEIILFRADGKEAGINDEFLWFLWDFLYNLSEDIGLRFEMAEPQMTPDGFKKAIKRYIKQQVSVHPQYAQYREGWEEETFRAKMALDE